MRTPEKSIPSLFARFHPAADSVHFQLLHPGVFNLSLLENSSGRFVFVSSYQ
jgi:hypothetical protein